MEKFVRGGGVKLITLSAPHIQQTKVTAGASPCGRRKNLTTVISSGGEGASFPRFLLLRVNIQKDSQGWVGGTKNSIDARWSGCVVFFSFSVSSGFSMTCCARLCVQGQTQDSWSRRVAGNLPVPCIKLDLVRDRLLLPVTLNPLLLTPRLIFSRQPSPLLGV